MPTLTFLPSGLKITVAPGTTILQAAQLAGIGTTTVVAYLLDGSTGKILGTRTMLNPQFPYGADVISRIQAALNGKLEKLTALIRDGEETGLCGSGLIDAVALLLELGVLNRRGRIQKDYQGEGSSRSYALTKRLTLTQNDMREVQMAKGAV